jgi:outer membrane protein TolC
MKLASHCTFSRLSFLLLIAFFWLLPLPQLAAEPITLKHAVELALSHGTTSQAADADEQRAFASYREARNQYLPQLGVGSGLGQSWGYPLSLEGSAPSIVNVNAQSVVLNSALRDFVRAANSEWKASAVQAKDQREQVIQETVLSYTELSKWEALLTDLGRQYADALKMEQIVNQRIQAGVDNPLARNQARLTTARVYLRISQAQGSVDVLRSLLSHSTGLAAASIQTVPESIPEFPEIKQDEDLPSKAVQASLAVQTADIHAAALAFRARGEHRALLPTFDFAAQYAVLATFNNWQKFFVSKNFQQNNATVGVVIRFPFLNPTQRAHAEAADAEALRARKNAEAAKNRVSEQSLRLQRSVEQLAAAQQVATLEYQIAQSNADAVNVRVDVGAATIHDAEDARVQASERFDQLQDARFELERARITLLRATGELEAWVGVGK